ncbi:MAG TPA: hypothetical protein VHJ82_05720 [Actinomycetota bacterium]|nr:hypothetical protein [Actinomycetota bacterium]
MATTRERANVEGASLQRDSLTLYLIALLVVLSLPRSVYHQPSGKHRHHHKRRAAVTTESPKKASRMLAKPDDRVLAKPARRPPESPPALEALGLETAEPVSPTGVDLSAYEGVATWIDIYNPRLWTNPSATVRRLARKGAEAVFVQTTNYSQRGLVWDPDGVAEFIDSAHAAGLKVVGWYVPSFARPKIDLRRSLAAIEFQTPSGERFDSFALDIEATVVRSIWLRNHRLLRLTREIRTATGRDYPLGAIIPDAASRYWPEFPYRELHRRYDVFIPMGYWTFQTRGPKAAHDHTAANIRRIRRGTRDPKVPIHLIGGLANDAGRREVRAFVRAARRHRVLGASLYDFPITGRGDWSALARVRRR